MARKLNSTQQQQLHQVAEVQTRSRRVEPAVVRDRGAGEQGLESPGIR